MEVGSSVSTYLRLSNALDTNNHNNQNQQLPDLNKAMSLIRQDSVSSILAKRKPSEPFKSSKNVESNNTTPSFAEIRNGEVLKKGDRGDSVKELQRRLTLAGFTVENTGYFGSITEMKLKQFQKQHGIQQTGKLGPTTIKEIDKISSINNAKVGIGKPTITATKLANSAKREANRRDTTGWCYAGVATAVSKIYGDILYGKSAYMAAPILARNSKFKEVRVKASDLPKLSAGTIVVWGKTKASPHGHISVALGNGKEASDHVTNQLTSLRGYQNFRVFTPTV